MEKIRDANLSYVFLHALLILISGFQWQLCENLLFPVLSHNCACNEGFVAYQIIPERWEFVENNFFNEEDIIFIFIF